MRRGVGAHSQPPQERLLSITSGTRDCDSVTHLWAPPPTVLPSTAAAPVFAPAALIPLQQRDLLQHTSDTLLWTSAILANLTVWGGARAFPSPSLLAKPLSLQTVLTVVALKRPRGISVEGNTVGGPILSCTAACQLPENMLLSLSLD